MSDQNSDQVLKLVKDIADQVGEDRKRIDKAEMSLKESQDKFEKHMTDLIEEQRKDMKRNAPPPLEYLNERESDKVRKGGLFGGDVKIPFEKMLSLSERSEVVAGTGAEEQIRAAHQLHDANVILYWHTRRKYQLSHKETIKRMYDESDVFRGYCKVLERMGYVKQQEVIDPDSTGMGMEHLTFELLSSQVVDKVRLNTLMPQRIRNVALTRPEMKWPVRTGDILAVRGGVQPTGVEQITPVGPAHPTSHIPSADYFRRPTYNAVQFDANHIMCFVQWDDDAAAEATIPLTSILREDIIRGLSRGLEKALLDGDAGTAAQHMDYDVTQSADANIDVATAWNGFRFLTNRNNGATTPALAGAGIAVTNALSEADIVAALNKMHRYAGMPGDLTLALPIKVYHNLLLNGNVITVDKFGPSATIKTGTLGFFMGVQLILPEFMSRYDLNNLGLRPNPAGTKSWALLFREDRFWLAQYGTARVETTRNAPLLHTVLQVDTRYDFKAVDTDLLAASGKFDTGKDGYPACGLFDIDTAVTTP